MFKLGDSIVWHEICVNCDAIESVKNRIFANNCYVHSVNVHTPGKTARIVYIKHVGKVSHYIAQTIDFTSTPIEHIRIDTENMTIAANCARAILNNDKHCSIHHIQLYAQDFISNKRHFTMTIC